MTCLCRSLSQQSHEPYTWTSSSYCCRIHVHRFLQRAPTNIIIMPQNPSFASPFLTTLDQLLHAIYTHLQERTRRRGRRKKKVHCVHTRKLTPQACMHIGSSNRVPTLNANSVSWKLRRIWGPWAPHGYQCRAVERSNISRVSNEHHPQETMLPVRKNP